MLRFQVDTASLLKPIELFGNSRLWQLQNRLHPGSGLSNNLPGQSDFPVLLRSPGPLPRAIRFNVAARVTLFGWAMSFSGMRNHSAAHLGVKAADHPISWPLGRVPVRDRERRNQRSRSPNLGSPFRELQQRNDCGRRIG